MTSSEALRELYQSVIMEHARHPRHCHDMKNPDGKARGHNPLCGDEITVYTCLQKGNLKEASFQAKGCAISIASASLMAEAVQGMSPDEVKDLFDSFHQALIQQDEPDLKKNESRFEKLSVLMGVRAFPARVKCATLAWHTLVEALFPSSSSQTISTE